MIHNEFKRIPMLIVQTNYHYSIFVTKDHFSEISSSAKERRLSRLIRDRVGIGTDFG